jgi:dipeptidyl aminopeptidase/acylaminoacyl peptidase
MFRAVEAGASVTDMISAYGGIRWGTGMSRAFQYEHTQSRIGAPPWERPLQFIENSPIFWVEKVQTPYLTMHNDDDDAVPWYQGTKTSKFSVSAVTGWRVRSRPFRAFRSCGRYGLM